MKYVVVSDIHGNAPALEAVIEAEGADSEWLVLGDIHGLNAYPKETMELLNELEPKVLLAGNHDKAIFHHNEGHVVSDALSEFELEHTKANLTPAQQGWMDSLPFMEVWQDGDSRIAATHAYPWPDQASGYEPGNAGVSKGSVTHVASVVADDYDWVFHGHTHTQYSLDCERFGHDVHFVNPGSLGYDGLYAVVDTDTGEVDLKQVEYGIEEVMDHIQEALPKGAPAAVEWR
jgi:protein phosphatase